MLGAANQNNDLDLAAHVLSTREIALTWRAENRAIRYLIQRRTAGQKNWTLLAVTTNPAWRDNTLAIGISYDYQVQSLTISGRPQSAVVTTLIQPIRFCSTLIKMKETAAAWLTQF